jgi:hypothetical protein
VVNHVRSANAFAVLVLAAFFSSGLAGCGSDSPGAGTEAASKVAASAVVDPNDRTHPGRATYFNARAATYRELARKARALSAQYAKRTPRPVREGAKDWNLELKVGADERALSLDQMAADVQALADFHSAEATKEVRR